MKAALIQRQIKLNCDVLTGLHEEYKNLRKSRKMYNERADDFDIHSFKAEGDGEVDKAIEYRKEECLYREQAAVFTPYIRKFKKKIAGLEEIQRCLKAELRAAQIFQSWVAEDDAFWLQQAQVAQQEGYAVTYSYEEASKVFGGEE